MLSGRSISLLFLLIFYSAKLSAQEQEIDRYFQDLIKNKIDESEDPAVYEQLLQIIQDPLDINTASRRDLESLMILKPNQINAIIAYRDKYGALGSIYELQTLPELDLQTLKLLNNFISVNPGAGMVQDFSERLKNPDKHFLLLRYQNNFQRAKGFKEIEGNRYYLGSQDKILMRYRFQKYNDYSAGLTLEKDHGEQINWDPKVKKYGADFISGHLFKAKAGILQNLVIGDYQLQYGQGLVFSSGFGVGKSSETILSTKQINMGPKPYSSSMEQGFLRGVSFGIGQKYLRLQSFYSSSQVDATLRKTGENETISGFPISGLHNSLSSMTTRKTVRENLYGINLSWDNSYTLLGIGYARQEYSKVVLPEDRPENGYRFRGRENQNINFYYDHTFLNFNVFGESAVSSSGGFATINGLIAAINRKSDVSFLYRNYARNYHGIRAAAFGESSNAKNEEGLYFGFEFREKKSWKLTFFYDLFSRPWMSFQSRLPGNGKEFLIRVDKSLNRKVNLFIQFRSENQTRSNIVDGLQRYRELRNFECVSQLDQELSKSVSIRTRIQNRIARNTVRSEGFAIIQDLRIEYRNLRMDFRISFFDTRDYDSRLYALEKDVLYSMLAPAIFGNGIRNYVLLKYKLGRKADLWIRWSQTYRNGVSSIGSSYNEVEGNKLSDLKFQLLLNL